MFNHSLSLGQKQQHKIIPRQIEYLHLLHVNHVELQQQISFMLEENPFLEKTATEETEPLEKEDSPTNEADFRDWEEYAYEDIPDYKLEYGSFFAEEAMPVKQWKNEFDFKADLQQQSGSLNLTSKQKELASYIIYYLNDAGMLEYDVPSLVDDIGFRLQKVYTEAEVSEVLLQLKTLEPAGVFSHSVRECLIAQLQRMNTKRPDVKKALELLEHYYAHLQKKNFQKIYEGLQIDAEEFAIIANLISTLSFKPLHSTDMAEKMSISVIPDFLMTFNEYDEPVISLSKTYADSLCVNHTAITLPASPVNHEQKQAEQYINNKIKSAQWFVQCIRQREKTMLSVIKAIVRKQIAFFKEGCDKKLLKPMILKNIADETGVDISTVSSVTSTKYVDTPFGFVHLKKLFTKALNNEEGEVVSNMLVKKEIEEMIKNEDKLEPYTDRHLVHLLAQKGYKIARRTVAKYRELMNIPVSYLRTGLSLAIS